MYPLPRELTIPFTENPSTLHLLVVCHWNQTICDQLRMQAKLYIHLTGWSVVKGKREHSPCLDQISKEISIPQTDTK